MEALRQMLNPEEQLNRAERNRRYVQRLLQQNQPSYLQFAGLKEKEMDEWLSPLLGEEQIHVAIVKIRDAHMLDDETMAGIGKTLAQLHKLGLTACVVLDADIDAEATFPENYRHAEIQAERVQNAVVNANGEARIVAGSVWRNLKEVGQTSIGIPNLLLAPIGRQVIPIITAFGYTKEQKCVPVSANGIVMALSRLFTDSTKSTTSSSPISDEETPVILDRIIFLDHLGGTPSITRGGNPHVYINLRQEFNTIESELASQPCTPERAIHMENLTTINYCLSLLHDDEASALITSPREAAFHIRSHTGTPGEAETKNPLIHNFLTNRPIISSSLPIRLDSSRKPKTTLLKLGMPLDIITCPNLSDPSINLDKLVYLINDSFGRELDTEEYLKRVDGNLAALIVAGDYEGAAIITWEYPEIINEKGEKVRGEKVPYLDKFAVLRKSQGGGLGVADVVFKAMVMGIFPKGVVWRSRRNNPVNRWVSLPKRLPLSVSPMGGYGLKHETNPSSPSISSVPTAACSSLAGTGRCSGPSLTRW
jgi:amino-acid N-acetyltransferase